MEYEFSNLRLQSYSINVFAASQSVKKIIEINPYMLGTMAGGAADCQFWHRNLGIKVLHIVCFRSFCL
jgi:20S proteasome alpha/beta subunit